MDNNGIPTIDTGLGVFADAEVQNAIRAVETPQVSIGNIVEGILAQAPTATNVCIDPYARKIYACPDAVRDNAGILSEINPVKSLVIGPVTGQTGRTLEWEEKSMDSGFPALVEALSDELLASAKPKRSVESLVSAIVAAIPNDTAEEDVPNIVVNQSTGTVKLAVPANRASMVSALDSAAGGGSDHAILTLAEPTPEDDGPDPLIFEGGPTGA